MANETIARRDRPFAANDDAGIVLVEPIFVVESVERFHADRPSELGVLEEPQEIPGGFLATYEDASGNPIYVMDQALDSSGTEAASRRAEAV